MTRPRSVRIVEVGPRDGLQNEPVHVPTDVKVALIHRLVAAGLRAIEVGSFVSPRWVPRMADSADVLARLPKDTGVAFPVLVPNLKGFEAARAAGAREVAIFASASEAFSRRNINGSVAESLARFAPVAEAAATSGIRMRGYVSCVLGCPYEGHVPPEAVRAIAAQLIALGCYEVSLGDTIGVGTPDRARAMVEAVARSVSVDRLALHFHDTYGHALANIDACLDLGVSVVDASVGGLGGCPYAPGATGNAATEAVVRMMQGLGLETGIDLPQLLAASRFITDALGREPGSRLPESLSGIMMFSDGAFGS